MSDLGWQAPARPPSWAIRQLRSLRHLEVQVSPDNLLMVSVAGGPPVHFTVEAKSRLGRNEASRIVAHLAGASPTPLGGGVAMPRVRIGRRTTYPLVATTRLVEATREVFRAAAVSWIEKETGRCCLTAPGLLVDTTLPPPPASERKRHWTGTLAGLSGAYVETLLLHYASRPIHLSESARLAGVSPTIASRILVRLAEEKLVRTEGQGPHTRRFLTHSDALLDLWAAEERRDADSVTGLHVWGSSPQRLYARLSWLSDAQIRWALGGVAAANAYAPTLTTLPAPEIWVEADVAPQTVAGVFEGEVTSDAPNLFVRQTRGNPALLHARSGDSEVEARFGPTHIVSRVRAYVEASGGAGRAEQVAAKLREQMHY